jgi:hypothetical protein
VTVKQTEYLLIARGKLRSHAETGAQFAAGRNCLNAFFIFKSFKSALFMIIGQPPARLDTKKWSAITVA